MKSDGRLPHATMQREYAAQMHTVRLSPVPPTHADSWPASVVSPVGRQRHRALRPIERPPSLKVVPAGIVAPAPVPLRRGRRVLLVALCLIMGLTAAALVAEGVLLASGHPLP